MEKALLMRSFNKGEIVEIYKITKEILEEIKKQPKKLSDYKDKEYNIVQILLFENNKFILREISSQKNDKFNSSQSIDIFINENDILIKTNLGYKKNLLPIKILTDKEEKTIKKYNKIGG